jgi:regulator of cell morphogenesis and NO signaling
MNSLSIETTVADIVRAAPARSRLFENLGIDYCCGGKKPLAEVCRSKGLDPATVVSMLSALDAAPGPAGANADAMSLSNLCDHIQEVHHSYIYQELPRLDFMTRKVAAVHGDHEPRLTEVRQVFDTFQRELSSHAKDEDENVFPAIRQLDSAQDSTAASERLEGMLSRLEAEHESAGAALARMRELTDGFTPPEWACNTFRALYNGLAELEKHTHQHVHKENNVLFPKVLARLNRA